MRKTVLLYMIFFLLVSVAFLGACAYQMPNFGELPLGSIVCNNRDCVTYKLREQYILLHFHNRTDEILQINPDSYPDLLGGSIKLYDGNFQRIYCSEKQLIVCSSDEEAIVVINCADKTVSSAISIDDFTDALEKYYCLEL